VRLVPALVRLLPGFALASLALGLALTLGVAGDTFGYDFLAYHAAASRVLAGQPAYDLSFEAAGGFGLFYYPPTFVPLVLPFGLLGPGPATWAWTALLVGAVLAGTAALPVGGLVRWLVVLLAGLSWPFLYAVKLGQVGPLLYLLMAIGWRWLDRGAAVGITGALGAAIKVQPGLILAWAVLARRWGAVAAAVVALVLLAALATAVAGARSWPDFLELVARVSDPIATPKNFTPGAVAHQLGVPRDAAAAIQLGSMALAAIAVVITALRIGPVPSYLVAVIASQLLSPILWDHYAILLLLPVAWLVDRGARWAVLVPLATSLPLVGAIPPITYPAAFWVTLAAVAWAGRGDHREVAVAPAGTDA
jgi:alpha-1,2-mannosyltransferase